MSDKYEGYLNALKAQKISLWARMKAARSYDFNRDMQVESQLLKAQIDAINEEMQVYEKLMAMAEEEYSVTAGPEAYPNV